MTKPLLYPICRSHLYLREEAADDCIAECVRWIANRSKAKLPDEALKGAPFQTSLDTVAPALAIVGTLEGEEYWGAKLRVSGEVPGRSWLTEIVVRKSNRPAFSIRLAVHDTPESLESSPPERTVPGILRQVVENVGAIDADFLLPRSELVWDRLESFRSLVLAPSRSMPVLLFGAEASARWPDEVSNLAAKLAGVCIVAILTEQASRDVAEDYSKGFTVFGPYAKLYYPIADFGRIDPFNHPLFRLEDYSEDELRQNVIRLASGIRKPPGLVLPRLHFIQAATHARDPNAQVDQESLDRIAELKEEIASSDALLDEASNTEQENSAQLRKLTNDIEGLEKKITKRDDQFAALNELFASVTIDEVPNSTPSFKSAALLDTWCNVAGGGSLVVTDGFLDSWDIVPDEPEYLYRVAIAMHGIAKLTTGKLVTQGRNIQLDLGVELCPIGNIQGFENEYKFKNGSQTLTSDWHAKWGTGSDIRGAFRIYYSWDTKEKQAILQCISTHLDNWTTT